MRYFKKLITVYETESTMELAKEIAKFVEPPFVLRAYRQSKGRGQYGRFWYSPMGGLYFTEVVQLENILGFSTFLSIPVVRVLRKYVEDVQVKWPNDIVVGRRKLGGILVNRSDYTYAGIGINVKNDLGPYGENSTRIFDFSSVDIELLFLEILDEEEHLLKEFVEGGFKSFVEEYNSYLAFLKKPVQIESKGRVVSGIVTSTGENGELLLETVNGIESVFIGTVIGFYR